MSDDNMQMDEFEFIKANFFASEAEMEQLRQAKQDAEVAQKARRKSRKRDPGLVALKRYVAVLKTEDAASQRAAIGWLADRFLGIKL